VLLASSFSFSNLPGIAVDGSGNVFVADYGASKVYEILAAGGYTTVNTLAAGFSFSSPTGIAVDGSGNVVVADYNNNAVEETLLLKAWRWTGQETSTSPTPATMR
jgi:DNA-binding beta-propeller fold protein YncE